jgi:hypothetical protein
MLASGKRKVLQGMCQWNTHYYLAFELNKKSYIQWINAENIVPESKITQPIDFVIEESFVYLEALSSRFQVTVTEKIESDLKTALDHPFDFWIYAEHGDDTNLASFLAPWGRPCRHHSDMYSTLDLLICS